MAKEHYLVPLGREPGGYLDGLGLPPDADVETVGKRAFAYLDTLQSDLKKHCQGLAAKKKEGSLTAEELEAQVQAARDAHSQRLAKLNEQKASYDAMQAQRRHLGHGTRWVEPPSWSRLFGALEGPPEAWRRFLEQRRPLPLVSDAERTEVQRRWIDVAPGAAGTPSAPAAPGASGGAGLAAITAVRVQRDLLRLLVADTLWLRLSGTNRARWEQQVQTWRKEIEGLGPRLERKAVKPIPATRPFPVVCEPRKLAVDRLAAGEVEKEAPDEESEKTLDPEFLAELLKKLRGGGGA